MALNRSTAICFIALFYAFSGSARLALTVGVTKTEALLDHPLLNNWGHRHEFTCFF
jgi:hypothetical protein